jgi:hypothetical protein
MNSSNYDMMGIKIQLDRMSFCCGTLKPIIYCCVAYNCTLMEANYKRILIEKFQSVPILASDIKKKTLIITFFFIKTDYHIFMTFFSNSNTKYSSTNSFESRILKKIGKFDNQCQIIF